MSKKNQKRYGRVTIYDSKKNFQTGKPLTTRGFYYHDEKEKKAKIKQIRAEQKEMNKAFKEQLKKDAEDGKMIITNRFTSSSQHLKPKVRENIRLKLDSKTGNTTCLIGSSKSGKTTLMMHLLDTVYNKKKYIHTMFAGNIHIPQYQKREKRLIGVDGFGQEGARYVRLEHFIQKKCKNKYHFVNWFDDIVDMAFSTILNKLVLTYRNAKMSALIAVQYDKIMSKRIRGNINNVICLSLNTDEAIEQVIKSFLKSAFLKMGLRTMNDMILFYKRMTKNRGFIYIHPASQKISFHRLKL